MHTASLFITLKLTVFYKECIMRYEAKPVKLFVIAFICVGVRCIISLSSYSGASTPPMYGDYEAQRHWQEITFNLPLKEWYTNSSDNDLLYWGLDYPPLTAYHSLVLGKVANHVNSSYVSLNQSRGLESNNHKSFMRLTVLAGDIIIYVPAAFLTVATLIHVIPSEYDTCTLLLLLLYPGQILIDNGHFQYNNISLGLFLFAVSCILKNRYNWASFWFSLAINYKQMELYHSLPFFVYLLRVSFFGKSFLKNIFKLCQIGLVTSLTFLLLWLPWTTSLDSFLTLLRRLFPIGRGVFEDKVANIWCSLNTVYKLKKNFNNNEMAIICLVTTLVVVLPANIKLFTKCERKTFLLALMNTSLSFFLFSFQVHEKSILLAAIPVSCLFNLMPFNVLCFLKMSVLSLLPLILKDNLHVVYFCITISYCVIFKFLIKIKFSEGEKFNKVLQTIMDKLDVTIFVISLVAIFLPPPIQYPHLWSLLISILCCSAFIFCLISSNIIQFNLQKYIINYFNSIKSK